MHRIEALGTIRYMVRATTGRSGLKAFLVLLDSLVLGGAWLTALQFMTTSYTRRAAETMFIVVGAVFIAIAVMRYLGLYLSRLCAVRSIEVRLIARATLIEGITLVLLDRLIFPAFKTHITVREVLVGTALMLVSLVIERSMFRAIVRATRLNGSLARDVIIVGCGAHAARLTELIAAHPDYGMRVVGVVGDKNAAEQHGLVHLWLGPIERAEEIAATEMVTGVVLSAAAIEFADVATLVKHLQRRQIHVQIANGLNGFDVARLRQLHLAREPMIYLEQSRPRRIDRAAKRMIDITVSLLVILLTSPILIVAAICIVLTDRGPVLFRQVRVGRNGKLFTLYKFRTMVVNAEQLMAELQRANERSGPLFKMQGDPRVTRIGRLLRLTSIDEIPQLLNVLKGQMSLVGPRPALPREVLEFDTDLRRRETVNPGITGLWQVEARDSPSFDAYRRLDLFYVDNWTITGDLEILLDTLQRSHSKPTVASIDPNVVALKPVNGTGQATNSGAGAKAPVGASLSKRASS